MKVKNEGNNICLEYHLSQKIKEYMWNIISHNKKARISFFFSQRVHVKMNKCNMEDEETRQHNKDFFFNTSSRRKVIKNILERNRQGQKSKILIYNVPFHSTRSKSRE